MCSNGSLGPAAQHLRGAAMKSYAPLAIEIFGSPVVSNDLKFWMLQSLILSRLLHNVHIIVPTRRFLVTIKCVCMRVLRRIAGVPGRKLGFSCSRSLVVCPRGIIIRERLGAQPAKRVLQTTLGTGPTWSCTAVR